MTSKTLQTYIDMKTRLLLLSSTFLALAAASAAPPQVTNVAAAQQAGTKLVNITYNLTLDANQTAFVELWFSPDNGLTYPVACRTVSGDVNASVSAGNTKQVTWNAGEDWNHQFTQNGKIRVIATYGDQPSGFSGTGSSGHDGHGGGEADTSLLTIPWDVYWEAEPAAGFSDRTDYNKNWNTGEIMFNKIKVDPTEITNEKWDEVADWALANGYPGMSNSPNGANPQEPRTGITYWEAIKWCNARSEKDGLQPVYHMDKSEAIGDLNGDGNITAGTDTFNSDPAFPNNQDTNGNGKWDPGEPFTDNAPVTGAFQPKEYIDANNNNQFDPGLSQVFRAGANIPGYGTWITDPADPAGPGILGSPIKEQANGYRLPFGFVSKKLATGGNHKKKWPWGDQAPGTGPNDYQQYADFVLIDVTATNEPNDPDKPTAASNRQPNGYGIKDLIGNVAEWTEDAYETHVPGAGNQIVASVFGGSYFGLSKADSGTPTTIFNYAGAAASVPENLFKLECTGVLDASSPGVGLRCVRYEK